MSSSPAPPPPPATYSQGPSQSFSQSLPTRNQPSQNRKSTQRCESCRSRKLFIQDGRLWCRRCGSLQEDFIQTQAEDDFTKLRSSQVTRQKKEVVEKVKKTLSGTKALYLYLSNYQLILQHLCRALIDVKGLPSTLEVLVKDLWELRMKLIRERYLTTRPQHGNDDDDVDAEQSDTTMYSSQTETEYTQTDTEGEMTERSAKIRKERDFPNIVDMLALCYMSCMILRIPLSVGNLFRWATREEIPFLRPLRLVPSDMQHGLGSRWLPFLQTRAPLQLSKLYSSIHDLHTLYYRNFSIQLPPLNYHPLLYYYITSLSLPIDLFPAITHLSTIIFTHPFSFPKPRRRTTYLTHPEVQLISMLVIAIKLFHPFPTNSHHNINNNINSSFPPSPGVGLSLGIIPINWPLWLSIHQPQPKPNSQSKEVSTSGFTPGEQIYITAPQILHLPPERIDEYMDWYEKTWLDIAPRSQGIQEGSGLEVDDGTEGRDLNGDGHENEERGGGGGGGVMSAVRAMFRPSRDPTIQLPHPNQQGQEEDVDEETDDILQNMKTIYSSPSPSQSHSPHTPGENYKRYRNIAHLGNNTPSSSSHEPSAAAEEATATATAGAGAARIFHTVLSHMAALSLSDLIKAVYTLERKLIKISP